MAWTRKYSRDLRRHWAEMSWTGKDTKDLRRFHVLAHKLYDWFEHHGKRLTAEEVIEYGRTIDAYIRCLYPALRILRKRNQRHPLARLEDRFLAA
jgi:hypothetical protein